MEAVGASVDPVGTVVEFGVDHDSVEVVDVSIEDGIIIVEILDVADVFLLVFAGGFLVVVAKIDLVDIVFTVVGIVL